MNNWKIRLKTLIVIQPNILPSKSNTYSEQKDPKVIISNQMGITI